MPLAITARRAPRLRALAAAASLATLGIAALGASAPPDASAAACGRGELCLYSGHDLRGSLYHFGGSDRNLFNDRYESFFRPVVARASESVWNRGRPDPSGLEHVALYTRTDFEGNAYCVPRGHRGDLTFRLRTVGSYRWVSRAACVSMRYAIGK